MMDHLMLQAYETTSRLWQMLKQVIVRVTAEDEERRTRAYSRDRSWEFMKVACARFLSWSG